MILVWQYLPKTNEFDKSGWAHKPETFFNMMMWKGLTPQYSQHLSQTGNLYYYLNGKDGAFHWTKEGLLDELREKGVIS